MTGLLIAAFPLAIVCFFQIYYLTNSFSLEIERSPRGQDLTNLGRLLSIIIPARDAADTIGKTLDAILLNNLEVVERLILVLDRCADATQTIVENYIAPFAIRGVPLEVCHLPPGENGKVAALLAGFGRVSSPDALLIDSDIILAPTAISEMMAFHTAKGGAFSSCLIMPHQTPRRAYNLLDHIICNNRLYRQSILQLVKNRYGAANFPGGFQLVEAKAYRELLVHGFLEDLTASYAVLATNGYIPILPRVLAFEVERQTLYGLFLQRLRWTIGALQHLPLQIHVANQQRSLRRWMLVNSYHTMWELQHYVIVAGVLLSTVLPYGPVMLLPLLLYAVQIGRSAHLTRDHYQNSLPGVILHILIFPVVITTALPVSLCLLAWKRRFFFDTFLLFKRL